MKKQLQNGMSLIEVLIVIAVVGVLSVAALTTINPFEQIKKANDTKRVAELAQVQRALELYYSDKGSYPQSGNNRIIIHPTTYDWGTPWIPYMNKLPADPIFGRTYVYYSPPSSNGQTYYLYASLERGGKDEHACNSGNACTSLSGSGFPAANSCGSVCNFGLSSPNVAP